MKTLVLIGIVLVMLSGVMFAALISGPLNEENKTVQEIAVVSDFMWQMTKGVVKVELEKF